MKLVRRGAWSLVRPGGNPNIRSRLVVLGSAASDQLLRHIVIHPRPHRPFYTKYCHPRSNTIPSPSSAAGIPLHCQVTLANFSFCAFMASSEWPFTQIIEWNGVVKLVRYWCLIQAYNVKDMYREQMSVDWGLTNKYLPSYVFHSIAFLVILLKFVIIAQYLVFVE